MAVIRKSKRSRWSELSSPMGKMPLAGEPIVNSELDIVHCESCRTQPMELVSAEPYFFIGISRLLYQCKGCEATSGAILDPNIDPVVGAVVGMP